FQHVHHRAAVVVLSGLLRLDLQPQPRFDQLAQKARPQGSTAAATRRRRRTHGRTRHVVGRGGGRRTGVVRRQQLTLIGRGLLFRHPRHYDLAAGSGLPLASSTAAASDASCACLACSAARAAASTASTPASVRAGDQWPSRRCIPTCRSSSLPASGYCTRTVAWSPCSVTSPARSCSTL